MRFLMEPEPSLIIQPISPQKINNTNASLLSLYSLLNSDGKVIPNTKSPMQSRGQHFEPMDWSTDTITEIFH